MIPADLLDQLRETDEELWEMITKTAVGEYEYETEDGYENCAVSFEELFDDAQESWLQHCIQDAIRARGWMFQLYSPAIGFTDFIVWIQSDRSIQGRGSTEAEALLRAYLTAIQDAT